MTEWATIPQMVKAQARQYADRTLFKVRRAGSYQPISWNEFDAQIQRVALGLIDLGDGPGDRVAILSENRPEWAAADLGILSAGAVTVPIYTTLTPEEMEYILTNAGVRMIFISTPVLMAKVLSFQEKLNLKTILFDAPYRVSGPRIWWFGELLGLGRTAGTDSQETLDKRLSLGKTEDLASIIYTSGTTGPPKGVMLSHNNFLSNCRAIRELLPAGEEDETLSFLPLSHVFERTAGYYFVLLIGGTISYAQSFDTVPANLLEVKPTILTAVPRFYEKFHERIREAVRCAPAWRRGIFSWATRIGAQYSQKTLTGRPVPIPLRLQHRVADRLVFSKLRARLGGRIRFCVSGGAPLSKELAELFYSAGILILEGYGLTETSPVITVNCPDRFRFGSVGLALPGVEVRIAPDGEILTRGPHVMRGYFNNPEATAEAIDKEGWFHTGDIGELSKEGFLTITDRKKDLIKTSGGKMVAPQNLEATLKTDPLITDCVVIGDRRKYLIALVVPNMAKMEAFARKQSITYQTCADLIRHPEAVKLIWSCVERSNSKLASFEQIKKISLLPDSFTVASGELTPTLKVKRRVIAQRYADRIEAMYQE